MPAVHRDDHNANYHQHESPDKKRAERPIDVVTRIPVAIEEQAQQTQILEIPMNELRNDFTPRRLRLDVGNEIEPLRQSLRVFRSEDQQRNQSECKYGPGLYDADNARLRRRKDNQPPGQ